MPRKTSSKRWPFEDDMGLDEVTEFLRQIRQGQLRTRQVIAQGRPWPLPEEKQLVRSHVRKYATERKRRFLEAVRAVADG